MSNKDLLKQAIAEAKTIREAAIANAKEALEESLTPHLKEMLAQKLQEMELDEDEMDEYGMEHNDRDLDGDGKVDAKDTGLAEAEAEEEEEEAPEEEEETEEEDVDVKDMSVEELKDLIRDIVSQEVGHDESEEEVPGEEAPEGEDLTGVDSEEEEIDINELLAELTEMEDKEGEKNEYMKEGQLDENVDIIYELIQMFPFLNNSTAEMLLGAFGAVGLTGIAAISAKIHSMAEKGSFGEAGKKFAAKLSKVGSTAGSVTQQRESTEVQEELNEALRTVKILRTQLQEVNLLNAKLLYVNKVFKANNLSESQKVNVVAAFDRAETVKEVKLVFETVSKNVVTKPVTIKEHKSFASKATGTSQTGGRQEIISEVSDTVRRMQKLAGIIK